MRSLYRKKISGQSFELSRVRKLKLTTVSRIFMFVFIFLGFTSLVWINVNPYVLFTTVGFFSAAVVFIPPAIVKNYDFFSTWSLVGVSIILGTTVRGIYIGVGYPDHETLDYFYFLGHSVEYFVGAAVLLLACISLMALGFIIGSVNEKKRGVTPTYYNLNSRKLYLFVFVTVCVSLVSIYLYVTFTGGFDIQNLSKKRTLIDSIHLSEEHRTWLSLRYLASIAMLSHLLVLADALQTRGKRKIVKYALAFFLFIIAAFIPFYASSRGIVFMYGIFSLALMYYVKQRIEWAKLAIIMLIAIFFFQVMSVLRTAKDISITEVASNTSFNIGILDRLVLNRNDLELGKTAHIMHAIPSDLQFQLGKTIAVWFIAPIPREIWNSKPLISSGPLIGTIIYGNRISGVPPGFVGEMFWNFHVPGVLIGGFFLGWLLRFIHVKFNPKNSSSLIHIVVYIYGPMQLGYLVVGTSLGFGLFNAGISTVLAYSLLRISRI